MVTRTGRGASSNAATRVIRVSRWLLRKGSNARLLWPAAHEMAHIALAHGRLRSERGIAAAFAAWVVGLLAVVGAALLPGVAADTTLSGGMLVAVGGLLRCQLLIARQTRPREAAADALAARWGYPLT